MGRGCRRRLSLRRSRPARPGPRGRLRGRCRVAHRVEARPPPSLPVRPVHVDRRIGEARRLPHRPERHRGHAGPAVDAGRDGALLRVPRSADGARRRWLPLPGPRRPQGQARRHARRHHRLRDPPRGPDRARRGGGVVRRRRASVQRSGARPGRRRAARPRARGEGDAAGARTGHAARHGGRRVLRGRARPAERSRARSDRRHPAGGDARRRARGDLPAMGNVERRPAEALRARARQRRARGWNGRAGIAGSSSGRRRPRAARMRSPP